ncbi:uncharacterized protein LOC105225617 isoform X1 [Bactrocera dorsalis]|uniref:Uncharacterized protein LOC105225617 isoform X1 n=3 Tax=Bactrocera dorsalis TaxID=27457 RepID=A0A6I9VGF4_BACDO|nr:uncharacterized protein LOC105225617 isoform X1 [Bactrocera dorsalis]
MAQYYQIQNLEDLKQIYTDVQVVHVASEDVGVGGHNRPQQLLLPDDQLMLNEGQQVVYQTTSVPAQQQYQQQPTATTTQYIIGDEISQQQQQQTVQHQQQVMYDHHHQQQQHYVHESQQLQQDHHQLAQQTQQQTQLYYTTEQILQPNSLVQQQQQQEMQHQQQQQQQLHVQQQQYQQQQQQQQQIVHQHHSMPTPQQTQQIVYRMQPQQQSQNQQTQMLNNAHVILQQPSGQQVLIQSPQHPEIIMRQSMPQQRIIYNTNRVLYTPQQQQQPQTQTILQQSPQTHQQHPQQQQHIQLQATPTTSPIHTTTRLVQARVGASPQETAQQHQQTPTQQNVVFHPIQATTVQNPQQLKPQIQQQSQMTIQQTPQQHLVASTMSGGVSGGGVMRGAIRNKSPRGGGALGSTHTLIARMPVTTVGRAIRPPLVTPIQSTQNPRATRPRGGAAGGARARGAARGARGGAVIASRNTQAATPVVQPQQQSQQLQAQQQITPSQQIIQNAMNKNITILNQQGQVKHIYRNIGDSQQQQLQLVTGTSQAQQRSTQIVGARFRTPVVSTSGNTNSGNNSNSSGNSSGNYELDLEDSIQAVVVKKDQQKPPGSTSNIANPVGTTLTSYFAKDDDDTRLVRTQNGACITLAEYRKRHPPNPGSAGTTTTTILQMKTPLRASGPPSSNKILPAHSSGNTGIVPVARVAPQPIQSTQQTQQSQTALTTTTSSSAVHRTSHNNYEIHTQHVMQNRNNTQMAEKDRNSAKMLVILVSGEQRLITFTLPRESCTVQDLLEQVGVPFDSSTTIQCVENPGANIDFVVTVGFSVQESASELISRAEQTLQMNRQQDPMGGNNLSTSNTSSGGSNTGNTNVPQGTVGQSAVTTNYGNLASNPAQTPSAVVNESTHKDANNSNAAANTTKNNSSSSSNTTEDVPRKIIQGFLAVCQSCGFSGYDHAKCERCKRVFLEPPKRVPSVKNLGNNASMAVDSTLSKSISNSEFMASDKRRGSDALARSQAKNALNSYGSTGSTTSARGRGGLSATARGRGSRSGRRTAEVEPVILTLSSDEEEDDESSNKVSGSFSTMSNAANSSAFKTPTYEPLSFEHSMPDLDENAIYADFQRDDVTDLSNCTDKLSTALQCKVVRIGTYRYEPKEPVTFTSKGVCLVAPLVNNPNDSFPLHIHKREVVKIIAHFSKVSESMLCFYTLRNCAQYIKNSLQMKDNGTTLDGSAYFSPNGPYQVRKIILQFSSCSDQSRNVIKSIWDFFDEISDVDAQDLLQRAEATDRQISNKTNEAASTTCVTTTQLNPNEIKQLLIYPPGKGGISINTEDYLCLATDQYLNDIIIDFYLKWVHNNVVPEAQRERAFIFSTFFYKRLTTLTRHHHNPDKDVKQTAAQKRHARVQNWTKNVNLFEKDFIIIPINEQSHWFLAIICFPTMKGPVTYDTNIPVEPQQLKKQKGKKVSLQIGNTTITPLSKRDSSTMLAEVCGVGDDDSERDEAEGDESDLASDDSDFDSGASTSAVSATISGGLAASNNNLSNSNTSISGIKSQAIKQPLILIFDSLAGASRSRVVATLRDYLTCEYRAKMSDVTPHVFNKDNMPGHCVKVPQQNNFTDCGLYLLQYVEHFFKDPIRDYRLPIKQLSNWFDTLTVTRKREDISQLLQQLMNERNGPNHQVILPEIPLPTSNGQLVEPPEGFNIEFEEEETGEDAAEEDDDNTDVDGTPNDADGTASSTHTDELVNVKIPTTKTATTTTALVPTQGRKIVVKRRLQQVSSATVGNNNSENLNTTTSVVTGVAGQNIRSGNQAKYRKFE